MSALPTHGLRRETSYPSILEAGCRLVVEVVQHVLEVGMEAELALEEEVEGQLVPGEVAVEARIDVEVVEVHVAAAGLGAVEAVADHEIFAAAVKHTARPHLMIQQPDVEVLGEWMEA